MLHQSEMPEDILSPALNSENLSKGQLRQCPKHNISQPDSILQRMFLNNQLHLCASLPDAMDIMVRELHRYAAPVMA